MLSALNKWNKNNHGNITERLKAAIKSLAQIQEEPQKQGNNDAQLFFQNEIDSLFEKEEITWLEKSSEMGISGR